VGVPIGVVSFLRQSTLTSTLWLAPVVAWVAVLLGVGLGWLVWQRQNSTDRSRHRTRATFLLSTMVGNTGYIGYPIALALVGTPYFAWAVFYDLLGSTTGAYGLGVAIAGQAKQADRPSLWGIVLEFVRNPTLLSFVAGIAFHSWPLPWLVEQGMQTVAWSTVAFSLLLVGMRLGQLRSLKQVRWAIMGLSIKMVLVPCLIGVGLWCIGINGYVHRALLLQSAMPPAFATLILSETYDLDQDLAVTTIVIGTLLMTLTLPLWLWLFPF
jgi:hypothetical protein